MNDAGAPASGAAAPLGARPPAPSTARRPPVPRGVPALPMITITVPGRVPASVRSVVLLAGLGLAVVPERLVGSAAVATAVATVLAAALPRVVGSIPVTAVFVLSWLASTGWHASAEVPRTVAAAALLYVLHSATALAACLPWDAAVAPDVVSRWVRRAAGPLAAAAVVVAADLALPARGGSAVVELAGLVGVVVLAVVAALAVLRRDRSSLE